MSSFPQQSIPAKYPQSILVKYLRSTPAKCPRSGLAKPAPLSSQSALPPNEQPMPPHTREVSPQRACQARPIPPPDYPPPTRSRALSIQCRCKSGLIVFLRK